MAIAKKPVVKKMAAKKPVAPKVAPVAKTPKAPRRRKEEQPEALMAQDEGYQVAKEDAVKFLHSRRQAMFALARRYHLDADDLLQEGYEVLLTCLRDFQPLRIKEDGTEQTVQFNTFFGVRLEGKALELRNRNPEYQARQAHMADLSDEEKAEFRRTPPLLVQHLDQETTMQETLRGEVSNAKRRALGSTAAKALADGFLEKKLNELIAQERDEKRRAALMHVKLGGVSSFEEIAYHFGVTDSRASQILNELMDAFYVQRLMGADLKSVLYDFRKLKFLPKRTLRLLTEAMQHSTSERAGEIRAIFTGFCPEVANIALPTAATRALPMAGATAPGVISPFKDPFTEEENARFPLRGLEFRSVNDLTLLPVSFRSGADTSEPVHITAIMEKDGDSWPLIVTAKGEVVDGARRLQAARTRGRDKVLCMVRDKMDTPTAMQYRVALNLRQIRPDKMDMYFAICALLDQGLSQQKAAAAVGTSRTNVIVYAKVKEKATAKMRALFEDGYLQITNASSCADLEEKQQDALADFIRTYGPQWGKGPSFNEAYEAAITGKLAKLAEKQPKSSLHMLSFPTEKPEEEADSASHPPLTPTSPPALVSETPVPTRENTRPLSASAPVSSEASYALTQAAKSRISALEQALVDAEGWAGQREATLAKQTQEIVDLNAKIEALQREISTSALLQSADTSTKEKILKEIKEFYAIVERLAGASHQVQKAARALRSMPLSTRQALEIQEQIEDMDKNLNALRVETLGKRPK